MLEVPHAGQFEVHCALVVHTMSATTCLQLPGLSYMTDPIWCCVFLHPLANLSA